MKKLYLIRHGRSLGNIYKSVYKEIRDYSIPLADIGWDQATQAGIDLNELIKNENSLRIVHSPWKRAKDTAITISQNLTHIFPISEDPLIYEQSIRHSYNEMKNGEDYENEERSAYGEYWYKVGTSESIADCYKRARQFYNDLKNNYYEEDTLVIVAHGVFIQMLIAVIDRLSVDEILEIDHPRNCEIIIRDI